MRRRLILMAHIDPETERKLLYYIGSHQLQWWHWIDSIWLLIDPVAKIDVATLTKDLPGIGISSFFLQEVPDGAKWGARLPDEKSEWIDRIWRTPGTSGLPWA